MKALVLGSEGSFEDDEIEVDCGRGGGMGVEWVLRDGGDVGGGGRGGGHERGRRRRRGRLMVVGNVDGRGLDVSGGDLGGLGIGGRGAFDDLVETGFLAGADVGGRQAGRRRRRRRRGR